MTTTAKTAVVGLGEMHVSTDLSEVLTCLGIGSCISVCVYDAGARVAGMLHVVLPNSAGRDASMPGKFADTGIPALLQSMGRRGADPSRASAKLVGGAQMSTARGIGGLFLIGTQNAQACREALDRAHVKVVAEDTGGYLGRSVRFPVANGRVQITYSGPQLIEL